MSVVCFGRPFGLPDWPFFHWPLFGGRRYPAESSPVGCVFGVDSSLINPLPPKIENTRHRDINSALVLAGSGSTLLPARETDRFVEQRVNECASRVKRLGPRRGAPEWPKEWRASPCNSPASFHYKFPVNSLFW